jgi:polysaccharide biosynthesis protein PslE
VSRSYPGSNVQHDIELRTHADALGAPRRPTSARRSSGRRASAQAQSPLPSPRDLLYVLFRHRQRAMVVAITIFALTLIAAVVLPSQYTSEAQLLVRVGRESLPTATVAGGPQMMSMPDRTTEVNSEAQIFRSREVVAATVKKLGVEDLINETAATDPDKLVLQEQSAARILASKIDIWTEPMSAIIKVSYASSDPTKAHDIVQTYVDCYLDHRSKIYGAGGTGGLFEGLTKDSEAKLKGIEESMKRLKDETGVTDVDTQKNILLNRIAGLQTTIDTVGSQLASTTMKIRTITTQMESTPKQIALTTTKREPMGVVSTAQNDLNKLRAELDEKLANYLPTSPVVVQLQQQVDRAARRLADLEASSEAQVLGLNPTWLELDKQLSSERTSEQGLNAQLASLTTQIQKAQEGQRVINDVQLQMGELAREQGMVVDQLKKVVEGRNYSSIDTAMGKDKVGSVSPSQSATVPTQPSSPNRKLLMLFGLFAALIGGSATAFVSEMLDHSVNKPLDLKRLGFGRVVSIPMMRLNSGSADTADVDTLSPETQAIVDLTEQDARPSLADRLRPTRYVRSTQKQNFPLLVSQDVDPSLSPREVLQQWRTRAASETSHTPPSPPRPPMIVNAPSSRPLLSPRLLETCHAMLERLLFAPVATGEFNMPRSIAVLSVTPGQGSSTIAAHLAAAMAEYLPNDADVGDEGRVLLVDGNLAAPALHRLLDVQNEPGISEWLKQPNDDVPLGGHVRTSAVAKLDILPAGAASVGHQPGRWGDAAAMTLQSGYHCVVLDLPSMSRSESTARVAGMCDAALLVVEQGEVNREVVRQAALRLAESGVRLLGVVLNKRTYPIPEQLYRWI